MTRCADSWSSGWTNSANSRSIGIRVAWSKPKIAALRSSQSMKPARRSTSQMPTELASSATPRRRVDQATSAFAAASSSSATTELASWRSSSASSSVQGRGPAS
jgi:hypothetical protein